MLKRSTEMSKPMVIRQEYVIEMINEIHDNMTNVCTSGAYTVASIIMDSIHEDAIWAGTQNDVTFGEIERTVQWWIDEETAAQAEEAEEVEVAEVEVADVEVELPKYGTFRTQIWTTGPNGYWSIEEVK